MATARQLLGTFGEQRVVADCSCPRCKRAETLVRLPTNFKCADVICDFCGYLAQVKAARVGNIEMVPKAVLGAAWGPQKERMVAAIYFPLFLVLVGAPKKYSNLLPVRRSSEGNDVPSANAIVSEGAARRLAGFHL